jgi:hypothetical protein
MKDPELHSDRAFNTKEDNACKANVCWHHDFSEVIPKTVYLYWNEYISIFILLSRAYAHPFIVATIPYTSTQHYNSTIKSDASMRSQVNTPN